MPLFVLLCATICYTVCHCWLIFFLCWWQQKKPKGASSIGCSSQLRNDDDDFVEGSSPFLGRMQRDPLWDAPDTDLNAEERGRFLTFKVRVPPSLFVEALEDMCAKFLPYV